MNKLLWIIVLSSIGIVLLLLLLFIFVCFRIEQIEEKEYNYLDFDIEKDKKL